MEQRCNPSTRSRPNSNQCVQEWHEDKITIFWNSCTTGTSSCCFLHKRVEAIRVREFSSSELLKCIPQFWNRRFPMNSAVNFSIILITTTYPSQDQFWDFGWKRVSFERFASKSVIPLAVSKKNNFFWMVHWIRRNFGLRRMRFLDAGLLQLCRTKVTFFFCNGPFQK